MQFSITVTPLPLNDKIAIRGEWQLLLSMYFYSAPDPSSPESRD